MPVSSLIARATLAAYDRPWWALLLLLGLVTAGASQWPRVSIDTSIEGQLGRDSVACTVYREFIRHFGSDRYIAITVSADDVLEERTLRRVRVLHDELEATLPYVSRIVSLINAPQIAGDGGKIHIGRALESWPASEPQWQVRRQAILDYGPYQDVLVNQDRQLTLIVIDLVPWHIGPDGRRVVVETRAYREVMGRIKPILARHRTEGFALDVTGPAAVDAGIQDAFIRDLFTLGPASLLLGLLVLLLLFQRPSAALIPVVIILSTVVCCVGLMGVTGQPMLLPTTVLPNLIVLFGVADAAHLLNAFYRRLADTGGKREAFAAALKVTAGPMLLTTLTTGVGLLSFAFVDLRAQANLGIFGACAAAMAFFFTLLSCAVLLRWIPSAAGPAGSGPERARVRRLMASFADRCVLLAARSPGRIVAGAAVLMLVSILSVVQFRFSHDMVAFLPDDGSEVRGMRTIDQHFRAGMSAELVVDSGRTRGIYDPAFIAYLHDLQQSVDAIRHVEVFGRALSIHDVLAEVSLAMDGRVARYIEEANGDRLLWRDLRLVELGLRQDYSAFVCEDHRRARIRVAAPRRETGDYAPFIDRIGDVIARTDRPGSVTFTGLLPVVRESVAAIAAGTLQSYLRASVIITLMMIGYLRNLRDGLLTMLPNLMPILVMLALMRWSGANLDVFTVLIASITIGIVIDDTIHFMSHFRRQMNRCGDATRACRVTLQESGQAMMITTLVLTVCFSVIHLSPLHNLKIFATYSTGIVLLGLLGDFILLPALMMWRYGGGARGINFLRRCEARNGGRSR